MNEIFPVTAGIVTGLICTGFRSVRVRIIVITLLSIVFGYMATVISGESAITWAFLYADIPLVAGSAVAALAVGTWFRGFTGGMKHSDPSDTP